MTAIWAIREMKLSMGKNYVAYAITRPTEHLAKAELDSLAGCE